MSSPSQPSWSPPLVRWAFGELPEWLSRPDHEQLEDLRERWEQSVLDRTERHGSKDRVRTVELLACTPWHPAVAQRAAALRLRFLAEVTAEEAVEIGRLAIESGNLRLVEQEDYEPARRAEVLAAERRTVDEIRSRVHDFAREGDAAMRQLDRRLGRLARRLHNQGDEALLARRLERVFGRRPVAWFARLTFWLLVLLLAFLIADFFVPEGTWFKTFLFWADTAICGVFLWEFVWRLAFAPRRHVWFARHFLTDFVPSLPFALMMDTSRATGWVRSVRFVRIPLYARYVRFLKPLVGFLRLLVFWVRGMDRLVQSLAPVLNRKIVLFEQGERADVTSFRDRGVEHQVTTEFERLAPAMRREAAPELLGVLKGEVEIYLSPDVPGCEPDEDVGQRVQSQTRVVRAEDFIDRLLELEAEEVERRLPATTVRSLGRLLRLADNPLLRWLPFVGRMVRSGRNATPSDRIAQAGRAFGGHCQKALAFVTGWADLTGVLTPTQVLDRIATALMKSTQRPAVRLLLFGSFFLVVKALFEVVPSLHVEGVVRFLDRFVATPLLVLGAVCLALLITARWLKRLAGEASDALLRSAESRYVNLLELLRRRQEDEDRSAVVRRLIRLELRDEAPLNLELAVAMDELRGRAPADAEERSGLRGRKVALLILDYQDGAFLHRTDTKAAEQFLSHPDLWSLRNEHLAVSRRELRLLGKLDLDSGGLFSGPYLWFDLVTHALAVKTARLCTSYNIHLIPLDAWSAASPEEQARHEALVAGTGSLTAKASAARPFRSSNFHVLHFLDPNPRWVDEIRVLYGEEVVVRLLEDRRRLVRGLFGMRALHRLPEEQRSLNPLYFYEGNLGGGRILLLPLRIFVAWLRLTWLMLRIAARSAREILDPRITPGVKADNRASFDVARRKIRRLKKPLLFAAIHLAARVDPEYLGLELDGSEPESDGPWESDLALAEPTPGEVGKLRGVRERAAARLLYLPRFLEALGAGESELRRRRRLACAFAMDERGIARLAAAEVRARAWLYAIDEEHEVPPGGLPMERTHYRARVVKRGYRRMLAHLGSLSRREHRFLRRAYRENLGDFRTVCQAFGEAGDARPIARATEVAERLLTGTEVFLGRLETLHALLAMAVQDLGHYESLVHELGGYGERTGHDAPAAAVADSVPVGP